MKKNNKKQKLKNKNILENYIELREKTDEQKKHLTPEENKKYKPREIILFDFHLKNNIEINKHSWEKNGYKVTINLNDFFDKNIFI